MSRYARHKPEKYPWLARLLERKPFKVVAVALANKMARIAWALLAKGDTYGCLRLRGGRFADSQIPLAPRAPSIHNP